MDFAAYWQYTDVVTKFLFFSLLALSIASWITGLLRLYQSSQLKDKVASGLEQAVGAESKNIASLQSAERKTVVEQVLLKEIGRYRFESEKGLAILGTTAAIAPFIGLFGTVWGIFHALHSIGESGQAGLSQVAGPVGEALIMTGLGLAVAIPAVIFYNIAVRINRKTLFIANDTAYGLLAATAKYQETDLISTSITQAKISKDNAYANSLNPSTANR